MGDQEVFLFLFTNFFTTLYDDVETTLIYFYCVQIKLFCPLPILLFFLQKRVPFPQWNLRILPNNSVLGC